MGCTAVGSQRARRPERGDGHFLITSSVAEARHIARDLHREEIDAAGFANALRDLAERKIWKTPCRLALKTELALDLFGGEPIAGVVEGDGIAGQVRGWVSQASKLPAVLVKR